MGAGPRRRADAMKATDPDKWTQEKIAKALRVSQQRISEWLRKPNTGTGNTCNPTAATTSEGEATSPEMAAPETATTTTRPSLRKSLRLKEAIIAKCKVRSEANPSLFE